MVGIIFEFGRQLYLKQRKESRKGVITEAGIFIFVCYLTALLALVLTPTNLWADFWYKILYGIPSGSDSDPLFSGTYNLIPSIFRVFSGKLTGGEWIIFMGIGNVLLFVPMGCFLPFVLKKTKFRHIVSCGFVTSAVIELLQPIVGRSFDIDDLILNTIGTVAGFAVYLIIRTIVKHKETYSHQ